MTDPRERNAYPGKKPAKSGQFNKIKKDWAGEAEFSLGSISLIGDILGPGIMGCQ